MNSIRYSRATVALLCVVGLLAVAGTAGAFTVSTEGDVPNETAVGSEVSVTYVIDDPYTDVPSEWTLDGETELENVSWSVEVRDRGSVVYDETYGEQSFTQTMNGEGAQDGDEVRITLEGTVPAVETYTYEPPEQYTVANLARVTGSNENEFRNDSAHHYTEDSREARQAINASQQAVADAPGDNSDAKAQLDRAISAYEAEDFDNAVSLAEDAEQQAEQAQQSQQTTQTLLYAAGAVVLLLLVGGGGFYLYSKSQEDDYSKL
ncbi:hypothetical protein [Haloarcula rara]|uniref:hypothetical protein n=1 Tax=Haloarcula rara TaxID=3033387 RepID=UPI0023E8EE5E|nr:hypothetical protein [Halomicroarcula sp. SHR3]